MCVCVCGLPAGPQGGGRALAGQAAVRGGGRQPACLGQREVCEAAGGHVDIFGVGDMGLLAGCGWWAREGLRRGRSGQLERPGSCPVRPGIGRPQGGAGAQVGDGNPRLVLQESHVETTLARRLRRPLQARDRWDCGWGGGSRAARVDAGCAGGKAGRAMTSSAGDRR